MALMALGINHQTAEIGMREKLAFDSDSGIRAAHGLVSEGIVTEAILISTCNRTELYCEGDKTADPLRFLIGRSGFPYEVIQPYIYRHLEIGAVIHLMRVASGLNSMVLGEVEILGQLKKAYTAAANAKTVGKHLDRLFQTAFSIAKRARSNTGIGVNPVSIAYAAAKLSQHIFSDLTKVSILLVGAGDLIRLMLKHLTAMGVKKIMVANRTRANAEHLANQFQGEAFDLEGIPLHLAKADIVITGTESPLPILGKGMVERALRQRKRKPMFMVDLSVPRNIEPEIGELEDVYLYCIDDLQNRVEENKRFRCDAAKEAEGMIQEAAEQFMEWLEAQDSFKTLCKFRKKFEQMRDELLEKSLHRLNLGEDPELVLKRLAYHLTSRFLHEPTRRLREAGLEHEKTVLTLTRDLFELNYETLYPE